jgi:predicted nuclease with TOPRIM domain
MEFEIEILNLKDEIKTLKNHIADLKSKFTKLFDIVDNLKYKYSELDSERLKIIVENQKIKAEMKQVTQPDEENINIQ